MSGENLFGQGRARTRQADDEHRPLRLQAETAHPLKERRGEDGHDEVRHTRIGVDVIFIAFAAGTASARAFACRS